MYSYVITFTNVPYPIMQIKHSYLLY